MSSRQLQTSEVPIIEPVSILIPATASRTISFPDEFFGRAVAIIITNLDATNVATYIINGASNPTLTLRTDTSRIINDTIINLITIQAGATGAVQIEAQVLLL